MNLYQILTVGVLIVAMSSSGCEKRSPKIRDCNCTSRALNVDWLDTCPESLEFDCERTKHTLCRTIKTTLYLDYMWQPRTGVKVCEYRPKK